MQSTINLRQLTFADAKTYLTAAIFIAGNIILPQLCHLFNAGGPTWLPIYFFTLVGAYAYGWRVGFLTALASPLINSAFFAMPVPAVLPAILLKSTLLAGVAGFAAARFKKISVLLLVAVVLTYQAVGTLGEWALCGDLHTALQDFRIAMPGMLLQIFGGYGIIKLIQND